MRHLVTLASLLAISGWLPLRADTAAFPFTYFIHDTTGVNADIPLSSIYQFPATPLGSNSHIVIKGVNTTQNTAFVAQVIITIAANSTVSNTNFTVTGSPQNTIIASGGSFFLTANFSPAVTGPVTGYMQTSYQVMSTACDFTSNDPLQQCPGGLNTGATFTAMATQPQLVLSYQSSSGSVTLVPDSSAPEVDFGSISASSSSITFTLSNLSNVAITVPAPTVSSAVFLSSPFSVDKSGLPNSLAAGASANFIVTFAPGRTGFFTPSLVIGDNSYPIKGESIVVADIDALTVQCVDSTGVNCNPQGQIFNFNQVVAGSGPAVYSFTVTNPTTSFNAVNISTLRVSGSAFTLGNLVGIGPFPADLTPGASFTFTITYQSSTAGNQAGDLYIGTRHYSLVALSINSLLPSFSLNVSPSPLSSQQQATVTVQFATASQLNLIGTISLGFAPSITNITDDPAIVFLGTNGRQLPITVAAGSQTATYNGQSALSFQTGTTAGAITFTVSFPNTPDFTQTFTVTPSVVQITSASAVRSNPNLVVTLAGYDNSYSAGRLSFTFYDTSGNVIAPVTADASGSFQQLFFNNNTAGGAFSLQATFPVTGDVTKVGSVAISVNNSVGQANSTQVF